MINATAASPAPSSNFQAAPVVVPSAPTTVGAPPDFTPPPAPLKVKRKMSLKLIVASLVFFLLVVGGGSAYWLSLQNQDVRQQAYGESSPPPGGCSVYCQGGPNAIYAFQTCPNQFCADGKAGGCAQAAQELGCYRTTQGCDDDGDCPAGYTCNKTLENGNGACVGNNESCTQWIRYACPNDFSGNNCLENGTFVGSRNDFISPYCGSQQIDCYSGIGTFNGKIDRSGCGGGGGNSPPPASNPPASNPPASEPPASNPPASEPPASNPPGPQCLDITKDIATPQLGDAVTFTCGQVQGARKYQFRVIEPDGTKRRINASGRRSVPYTIATNGTYIAQCRICTTNNNSSCKPWESLGTGQGTDSGTNDVDAAAVEAAEVQ